MIFNSRQLSLLPIPVLSTCCGLALFFIAVFTHPASGAPRFAVQETSEEQEAFDATKIIEQAAENMAGKQKFQLKYNMPAGAIYRWEVEHTSSAKTHMAGETEEASSRTLSINCWKVTHVDATGNMTFEHSIEAASMWQKIGENDPITYDSANTQADVPMIYQDAAKKIGKTLATFIVTPSGQIKDKQSPITYNRFGIGDIVIPLPEGPVTLGHKWYVPTFFQVTSEEGHVERLSARVMYQLEKVVENKAYITIRTQVLTPITSDQIRSQLMQQLNSGYAVLDLTQGIVVHKQFEWNEKVQQVHKYEGSDGFLQYLAKLTEKQIVGEPVTAATAPEDAKTSMQLKTRDGAPLIRK